MTRFFSRVALLCLVVVAIYLLATAVGAVGNLAGLGNVADLPLSRHAQQSHTGELMSVFQAQLFVAACSNVEAHICERPRLHAKLLCPFGNSHLVGLIVGLEPPEVIVTGYIGTRAYWDKAIREDGCISASVR